MPRLLLAFLLVVLPWASGAQIITGGIATDSATGARLGCLDVALVDESGRSVGRTRTRLDGGFQFVVPEAGVYRIRFSLDGDGEVLSGPDTLERDAERLREYRIAFALPEVSSPPPATSGQVAAVRTQTPDDAPAAPLFDRKVFPRYPPRLREDGVQGGVVMQFVLDSAGRAMPRTIRPVMATHPDFVTAARDYLERARYLPARRDGANVCSLLQQPFWFHLDDGSGRPSLLHEMMRRMPTRGPLPANVP